MPGARERLELGKVIRNAAEAKDFRLDWTLLKAEQFSRSSPVYVTPFAFLFV